VNAVALRLPKKNIDTCAELQYLLDFRLISGLGEFREYHNHEPENYKKSRAE
jgi:hypothetical protein